MLLQAIPLADGGPLYTETDFDRLIVEPWNAGSAVLFLLVAVFWAVKLRGKFRQYPFFAVSLVILTIGAIGGTVYHAFRYSEVFLMMDWLPIMVLCLLASGFFLFKAYGSWWPLAGTTAGLLVLQEINFRVFGSLVAVNVSYVLLALVVLTPVLLLLLRTRFHGGRWIGFALGAFVFALFFRISDGWGWLPMGTHFLWHLFGALAAQFIMQYTYEVYRYGMVTG